MKLLLLIGSIKNIKDSVVTLDWINIEYKDRIVVLSLTHSEYIVDIDQLIHSI